MQKIDLASQAQAFRIMSIIKQSLAFPLSCISLQASKGPLCCSKTLFVVYTFQKNRKGGSQRKRRRRRCGYPGRLKNLERNIGTGLSAAQHQSLRMVGRDGNSGGRSQKQREMGDRSWGEE